MTVGGILKLAFFLLWPLLLVYLYYWSDKDSFKERIKRLWREKD
ncbi:MAG: hypothetical protein RQ715_05230 [Methylococcales bacterium]|nr:hypothetical protein [Methylococcales bacterium]